VREPLGVAEEAAAFWDGDIADWKPSAQATTARRPPGSPSMPSKWRCIRRPRMLAEHPPAALASRLVAHRPRRPHGVGVVRHDEAVALGEEPTHAKLLRLARSRPDGISKTDAHHCSAERRLARRLAPCFLYLLLPLAIGGNGRWFCEGVPARRRHGGWGGSTDKCGLPNRRTANLRTAQCPRGEGGL